MRLLCLVTTVLLAATTGAFAGPSSSQLPFEVVQVMAGTQQVLVFDRGHNTHVLLSPGQTFDDYVVVEISGIGMTLEKQVAVNTPPERFTVYPRAAMGLALDLEPSDRSRLPAVYSTTEPKPAAKIAATKPMAVELASLLATSEPPPLAPSQRALWSPPRLSKLSR